MEGLRLSGLERLLSETARSSRLGDHEEHLRLSDGGVNSDVSTPSRPKQPARNDELPPLHRDIEKVGAETSLKVRGARVPTGRRQVEVGPARDEVPWVA